MASTLTTTTGNTAQAPRDAEPQTTQRQPVPSTARTDSYRFRDFASI